LERTGLDRSSLLRQIVQGNAEGIVHAMGRTRELSDTA
jgi:hypothetical protein